MQYNVYKTALIGTHTWWHMAWGMH